MYDDTNLVRFEDYGIPDLSDSQPASPAPVIAQPEVISYAAVKIAQAKTGETELRLLRIVKNDVESGFSIQRTSLHPYSTSRQVLETGDAIKRPMTQEEALQAFDSEVKAKYPAINLSSGRLLATHLALM